MKLLLNKDSFNERIILIQNAKKSIHMVALLIMCDDSARKFIGELIAARKRGVDVRLIVDGAPWWYLQGRSCLKKLRTGGILVAQSHYFPVTVPANLNVHEKYLIVDSTKAVTGGQNVGNLWAKSNGVDDNFRDTDIFVEGPIVRQIAHRFLDLWKIVRPNDSFNASYTSLLEKTDKEDKKQAHVGDEHYESWLSTRPIKGLCRLVVDSPYHNQFDVMRAYSTLAESSLQRIIFHVPSFNAIGSNIQQSLKQSFLEFVSNTGGNVDIITNGPALTRSSVVPSFVGFVFSWFTLNELYDSIIDTPFHVYVSGSWLHSKVYSFDNVAVAVGSLNFDETVITFSENAVICMDEVLSNDVENMLQADLINARKIITPSSLSTS